MHPEPEYVSQFDVVPEFWQFLNGLNARDLIAELIQNDLDANALHTEISFLGDRLICRGDGQPIDNDGWKRLSYMRGAGDEVPRKKNRIGIKNHGLKACFTIGNEIVVRSADKYIKQTLYRYGESSAPYPGAFKKPAADPNPPNAGCELTVRYRKKDFDTSEGEPLRFAAVTDESLEQLFIEARDDLPRRFMGVIRPGARERYSIQLSHHKCGEVNFEFSSRRSSVTKLGLQFERTCRISGTGIEPRSLFEVAFAMPCSIPKEMMHEIPEFYRVGRKAYVEVAVELDRKAKPIWTVGYRRYPIAYTGHQESALSGRGVHYSAPYVSDQERHGASGSPVNRYLLERCDEAAIVIARDVLLPKYGPRYMNVILPQSDESPETKAAVQALLEARSVPLEGKKDQKLQLGPRRGARGSVIKVTVPAYSWAPGTIVTEMQVLCPRYLDQIHRDTPKAIVKILGSGELAGWELTHVRFDEVDVLESLQIAEHPYFSWKSNLEHRRALADLNYAKAALNVIEEMVNRKDQKVAVDQLKSSINLPDSENVARPLGGMYASVALPPIGSMMERPSLINPELLGHPLFRRKDWKLPKYTAETFISSISSNELSDSDKRRLWRWLTSRGKDFGREAWSALMELDVWPTKESTYAAFAHLCSPRNKSIENILKAVLSRPSIETERLVARFRRRGLRAVREVPNEAEFTVYFNEATRKYPVDRVLTDEERKEFHQFESDLIRLANDSRIARLFAVLPAPIGLACDGVLRPLEQLAERNAVASLKLLPEDLLERATSILDRVMPASSNVSVDAIVRALTSAPESDGVLFSRLRALLAAIRREGLESPDPSAIACIPDGLALLPPGKLAFRGNRGDFWTDWKVLIATGSFSGDEQRILSQCGVTGAEPTPETSLAFFTWLNLQPSLALRERASAIFRHLVHRNGVTSWWEKNPRLPCVLVEKAGSLEIVSLAEVRAGHVYLPDFDELAVAIRNGQPNQRIMLAINTHRAVSDPGTVILKEAGAKSLYEMAKSDSSVKVGAVCKDVTELHRNLSILISIPDIKKRLADLEVSNNLTLRTQWREQLRPIRSVRSVDSVTAAYRIGGRWYDVAVRGAFDATDGIVWLRGGSSDVLFDEFFEVLSDRIFENPPRWASAILQKLIRMPRKESPNLLALDEPEGERSEDWDETVLDEPARYRHAGSEAVEIVPSPRPLPSAVSPQFDEAARTIRKRQTTAKSREVDPLELQQIAELKVRHYAWHCQVCLANRLPSALAPDGSYVAIASNRQRLIEAHHVHHVEDRGARHAGNILVLCYYHHHEFGDLLNRQVIREQLQVSSEQYTLQFGSTDVARSSKVMGYVVNVDTSGRKVALFFTADHKKWWLEHVD